MEKQAHTLDILFPLGLLAAFAASVITVLLLTAGVYRGNVERSAASFAGPTALAYVTEKLHQSDAQEAVRVGKLQDCDALILTESQGDAYYDTYIYCYGGFLRELMVKRELEPAPAMGRELLELEGFTAERIGDDLLEISCTDGYQVQRRTYISLRGGEDVQWN